MHISELVLRKEYTTRIKLFDGTINTASNPGEIMTYIGTLEGFSWGTAYEFSVARLDGSFIRTAYLSAEQVCWLEELDGLS